MNEKEFIEQYFTYGSLDENKIKNILYFSLIWNIFEERFFDKNAKTKDIDTKIHLIYIDTCTEDISRTFNYFKHRYITNGEANNLFKEFKFNRGYKEKTKQILISSTKNKEKLLALLYIAFRLRNNLYHGEKDIGKLYEQNENFKQINNLLICLLNRR